MTSLFVFICAAVGILFGKLAVNMKLLSIYLFLTVVGLLLYLSGRFIFSAPVFQAALGSIAFTSVFLLTWYTHKKKQQAHKQS